MPRWKNSTTSLARDCSRPRRKIQSIAFGGDASGDRLVPMPSAKRSAQQDGSAASAVRGP